MGVFATRSPFRPNPIALSCVKLEGIEQTAEGPVLRVRGADLVDGTPILDIKPYIPYADCHPDALGRLCRCTGRGEPDGGDSAGAAGTDSGPAGGRRCGACWHRTPGPITKMTRTAFTAFPFAGMEVRFTVEGKILRVRDILPAKPEKE